jgi:hypothetical protein
MKKCPNCECTTFSAHQVLHADVTVNGENSVESALDTSDVYHADPAFGPYTCADCGNQYDTLEELPDEGEEYKDGEGPEEEELTPEERRAKRLETLLGEAVAYLGDFMSGKVPHSLFSDIRQFIDESNELLGE